MKSWVLGVEAVSGDVLAIMPMSAPTPPAIVTKSNTEHSAMINKEFIPPYCPPIATDFYLLVGTRLNTHTLVRDVM